MATPKQTADAPADVAAAVFRDTVYTSRVLILPDGRQLAVAKGRVSADASDAVALEYLQKHPDLKPQE